MMLLFSFLVFLEYVPKAGGRNVNSGKATPAHSTALFFIYNYPGGLAGNTS